MSAEAVKTLIQAFISCHLDYCNSLFYGIADGLMNWLQSLQNADARLVLGARRYRCCTGFEFDVGWISRWPPWSTCHCPPSGMPPAYLAADCQLVSDEGRRQLCSTTSRTCVVRQTYSNYGDFFADAGSKLCKILPTEL